MARSALDNRTQEMLDAWAKEQLGMAYTAPAPIAPPPQSAENQPYTFKLDCHGRLAKFYGLAANLKRWVDDIRPSVKGIGRWYYGYARYETPTSGWTESTSGPAGDHAELEPQ